MSRPTFTNVDPALDNIIVRQVQNTQDGTEDWEVTLIDWAYSGWYPEWVQADTLNESVGFWTSAGTGKNYVVTRHDKETLRLHGQGLGHAFSRYLQLPPPPHPPTQILYTTSKGADSYRWLRVSNRVSIIQNPQARISGRECVDDKASLCIIVLFLVSLGGEGVFAGR
ncbi:hypothetical protein J1614_003535 [Plenodomus biglobosus]|nr:hypothetical protein J1614_003535 [Plenodomus biglobosus]